MMPMIIGIVSRKDAKGAKKEKELKTKTNERVNKTGAIFSYFFFPPLLLRVFAGKISSLKIINNPHNSILNKIHIEIDK